MALGDQDNPYIVTTWADLVARAAENGKYVKVGNNIDVLTEYSDGSAPTLVLNSYVDGDNKTISRWYCTGQRYMITTNNTTYIKNAIFTNIKTGWSLVYNVSDYDHEHITVQNCKFAGIMGDGYVFAGQGDTRSGKLDSITVNIKGGNLKLIYHGGSFSFSNGNFNVKLKTSTSYLWDSNYYMTSSFYDSYFELDAPNMTSMSNTSRYLNFDNCVLNLKSNGSITFDSGNSAISIFNSTNAPNAVGTAGKIVGVDDTHWLDAAWIANNVGFNIVAGD